MLLKYSNTGIPYISFDDENRLAFSSLTADNNVYKNLIGHFEMRGEKYRDSISFITNLKMSNIANNVKNGTVLDRKTIKSILGILGKYVDCNGCFPKNRMNELSKDISII